MLLIREKKPRILGKNGKNSIKKALKFCTINSFGKKEYKNESLPVFQGFRCKNPGVTSSVSQRGLQGLTYSTRDRFTGPVTDFK